MSVPVTVISLNYLPEPTGGAPYAGGLAEGLASRGWEVGVVAGLPHYPQWKLLDGYAPGTSVSEAGVHLERRGHPVPAKPGLLSRCRMELTFGVGAAVARWRPTGPVVLVSPALFGDLLAAVRARLTRRPVVVWMHDIYSLGLHQTGTGGGLPARVVALLEGALLRSATAVVVIHDRFKTAVVRDFGVVPDRVHVIRNWSHVDTTVRTDRTAMRARLGWPEDVTVVLHAGNMGVKQGLENVVAASAEAHRLGRPVLFVLMGDGNRRAELEAAGGNPCLRIVDPVPGDDFVDALRAADVLLVNELPGMTEMAVPSKLTSYFASGRPVLVATDRGSVTAEEVATADAGLRVDAGRPEQLVEGAMTLRADPTGADQLGRNGMEFRERMLTAESALDRFADLLSAVGDHSRVVAQTGFEGSDNGVGNLSRAVTARSGR